MLFRQLFDAESSTYSYLLADSTTREAVLIDPVIEQLDRDIALIGELGLKLRYAIDTHVHADHVTASGALRERLACKTVLSAQAGVGCADVTVIDGDILSFGQERLQARETPGHTSGCTSYVTADQTMVFTGDALLIRGCGRTDFQGGDAAQLYRSVQQRLFNLPRTTLVYPAHDYLGRTMTTIEEELRFNPRLGYGKTEQDFVETMSKLELAYPKKIDVALPQNLRCGTAVQAADSNMLSAWYPIIGSAGVPEVSPEWVAQHASEVRIVDVRDPAELVGDLGHIAGVEAVPLAEVGTIRKDDSRPTVTVCRSGKRSATALQQLRKNGFERLASMQGGMLAWAAAALPVVGKPT